MLKKSCIALLCSVISACGGGAGSANPPSSGTPPVQVPPPAPVTPPPQPVARELRILVIGQSISSNCNQHVYGPIDNIFQIGKDGNVKPARDPFEWADCDKGSMWMPLGKRIIDSGMAQKVVFMPIGVGATSVRDWQADGRAFGKLNAALDLAAKEGIRFDAVLWHQGSADYGMARSEYTDRLLSVISYVNGKVQAGRWLVGVHSRCSGRYDANIEAAQRFVGEAPAEKRYLGANTNVLGNEFRFDECHLNQMGQEQMAGMWLEALRNAGIGN